MLNNQIIESHKIKYIFVESGELALRDKAAEIGIEFDPKWNFWVELSIGSGAIDDVYDKAWNSFGETFDDAVAWPLSKVKHFFGIGHPSEWNKFDTY